MSKHSVSIVFIFVNLLKQYQRGLHTFIILSRVSLKQSYELSHLIHYLKIGCLIVTPLNFMQGAMYHLITIIQIMAET